MIDTLSSASSEKIYSAWARIITTKGESGIYIRPPCSDVYRVRKFIVNPLLHEKYFGDKKPVLLLINAEDRENITFEELEKQVMTTLHLESVYSIEEWLTEYSDNLAIFLYGYDEALQKQNVQPLLRFASLLNKYSNFSLILLTQLNIPESALYYKVPALRSPLEGISYQELRRNEDALQFLNWIQEFWNISIHPKLTTQLVEHIGSHFFLLKEGVRLVQENPQFTIKDILEQQSLKRKALTIFELLSEQDQKIIGSILTQQNIISPSEYLTKTRLVQGNKVGITYWEMIKKDILAKIPEQQHLQVIESYFTPVERDVFSFIQESNTIVSREAVAQKIWKEKWQEKYSDWAIDQLIHKIREKLVLTNTPFRIETKKKLGFEIKTTASF